MNNFEVDEPILNSPYEEPKQYWDIRAGEAPRKIEGQRRLAGYFYRPPSYEPAANEEESPGDWVSLEAVNLIRERLGAWRKAGYPGVSRITLELLNYWRREGRKQPLFFAQLEAAETIIFLTESRSDFLQGISSKIPLDEPSDDRKSMGFSAFRRYACKMATGSGKTTVMGMLAAWSILNKVTNRSDARFSDAVIVVCPNITIKTRLEELRPERGEASLYRTRDLVPAHLMSDLISGRVVVRNWHVFEPQAIQTGGVSSRVSRVGVQIRTKEKITIGAKTTTARGKRYLTRAEYDKQVAAGLLKILEEERDEQGNLLKVLVESSKYVESDTRLLERVLGREIGRKQNILIMNDEAHHAYRLGQSDSKEDEEDEEDDEEYFFKEATIWIDGLDKIHKNLGINFCVDLSATPYYLGRVGQDTNRIFPWVVSDFGLTDAIESGLVKIPQLAVRDTTGDAVPGYFNIWRWILPKLTPAERGGRRSTARPEAVLKYAATPLAMLSGLWKDNYNEWKDAKTDPRPPVFIVVCKNTKLAKLVFEWMAQGKSPTGIPSLNIPAFRNTDDRINTIRVDSRVVHETDSDETKSDDSKWMRLILDTVGKSDWPKDRQRRSIYPEGFEDLAQKLNRPLHPPGRDICAIVSVGMLTEGWDCNTVTHIIGLRPFMSQLLCEQVIGRGLRRRSYDDIDEKGRLPEEVSKILGVPFQIIPFKENKGGTGGARVKTKHVYAIPEKSKYEIKFPRVEGYRQAIRNRIKVDWSSVPTLTLDPMKIPPEVEVKATIPSNQGRPSLIGPGKLERIDLNPYRVGRRFQELAFQLAGQLTKEYISNQKCEVPAHVLFPQVVEVVEKYLREKVVPLRPADLLDVFLSPYYGWVIERLLNHIHPDVRQGETPELPIYESNRGPGSTIDVDFWTGRDVREVINSHLNYVVADTKKWEQSAAYFIDTHRAVEAFVKNSGLGFAIPYVYNGQTHDYLPDFIIRLKSEKTKYLILETKGFDPLTEVKADAAQRWVNAVNADASFGVWNYRMAKKPHDVTELISSSINETAHSTLSKGC